MATIIDPGTRSPGHLVLFYTHHGSEHTTSCRFVAGVDLDNISLIKDDADHLAAQLKKCITNVFDITDFGVRNNDGRLVFRGALSAVQTGLHSQTWTADYYSPTLTAVGRGNAIGAAYASGVALLRFKVGGTYTPLPGQKAFAASSNAGLADLASELTGNLRYFADFYGQKADCRDLFPYQLNAHLQRRDGT